MTTRVDSIRVICWRTVAVALVCAGLESQCAVATTTSLGQTWNFEPDAWSRGNNADTSYFGWDVMERSNPPRGFAGLTILDDTSPDLGGATSATNVRLFQGNDGVANPAPTTSGHVSGSMNYYSFADPVNDTITAVAPASGTGGHTTVALQVIGNFAAIRGLSFAMDNSTASWNLEKQLYGLNGDGSGLYWVEWTAPGSDLAFKAKMSSFAPHQAIDAFQVDTYWTPGASPVVNSIQAVPEPAAILSGWLAACGGLALCNRRRGRADAQNWSFVRE